jgi:hypothetical protein
MNPGIVVACGLAVAVLPVGATTNDWFGIRVIDDQTGRGVPLVELETVNHVRFVTDNAGWIALHEPGWFGQSIHFTVRSHGYAFPKDGFGYAGKVLTPQPGARVTLRLPRRNLAERLYRVTGEGLYRDSLLLGEPCPLPQPLLNAHVVGQDSAFAVSYRGQLHWFWGDTARISYPLGHFWMAGATSAFPNRGGLDPAIGVNLRYFVGPDGFSRPMCRLGVERGLIWADGFAVVPDDLGRERLVAHFAHMESLEKMLGHGLAVYDDNREEFTRVATLDLADLWRWPAQAHPIRHREGGQEFLIAGEVFPVVRVPAQWHHWTNLASYEGWTCLIADTALSDPKVNRDTEGRLVWSWQRSRPPVDPATEAKLVASGVIKSQEARMQTVDVDSGKPVRLVRGSVNWNVYRQRWIAIAVEQGGTSNLGEIWYAEAPEPTGPWREAKKIVTHDRYSFYNPVHHAFFDQEGGRLIYFEGTYVTTFSGNAEATPRYDYNQVMYRLDLADPRLGSGQE